LLFIYVLLFDTGPAARIDQAAIGASCRQTATSDGPVWKRSPQTAVDLLKIVGPVMAKPETSFQQCPEAALPELSGTEKSLRCNSLLPVDLVGILVSLLSYGFEGAGNL